MLPSKKNGANRREMTGLAVAACLATSVALNAGEPMADAAKPPSTPPPKVELDVEGLLHSKEQVLRRLASASMAFNRNNPDLGFLDGIAKRADLIGLGDSVHGSADIWKLKLKMIQYLVEKHGTRCILFEDDMVACAAVNDYIQGRPGISEADAISGLFRIWRTQEILDLIRWMRSYNAQHQASPISFVGIDYQTTRISLPTIRKALPQEGADLARKCLDTIERVLKIDPAVITEDDLRGARLALATLDAFLHKGDPAVSSPPLVLTAVRALRQAVAATEEAKLTAGHEALGVAPYRDLAMASNVRSVLESRNTGKPAVILAHTAHLSQETATLSVAGGSLPMGCVLKSWYRDRYAVVSIHAAGGFVMARAKPSSSEPYVSVRMSPPRTDSLEGMLRSVRSGDVLLHAKATRDVDLPIWSLSVGWLYLRDEDDADLEMYASRIPHRSFDYIVYLDGTTAASKLAASQP